MNEQRDAGSRTLTSQCVSKARLIYTGIDISVRHPGSPGTFEMVLFQTNIDDLFIKTCRRDFDVRARCRMSMGNRV